MAIAGFRLTVFRRAAPWLFAGGLALGCGSSQKTSYGSDANPADSAGAAGAGFDARGDVGGEGAAGAGAPDASDAVSDGTITADTTSDDAAADATSDHAPPPPDAAQADTGDASGAAGSPAPHACVLGSSTVGGCVLE